MDAILFSSCLLLLLLCLRLFYVKWLLADRCREQEIYTAHLHRMLESEHKANEHLKEHFAETLAGLPQYEITAVREHSDTDDLLREIHS